MLTWKKRYIPPFDLCWELFIYIQTYLLLTLRDGDMTSLHYQGSLGYPNRLLKQCVKSTDQLQDLQPKLHQSPDFVSTI